MTLPQRLPRAEVLGTSRHGDPVRNRKMMPSIIRRSSRNGRPRRLDRVPGDKAYSSRAIRQHLRDRGIPEPSDQIGHRQRRGSRGGRPPEFDATDYRGRNVVERGFCDVKEWRGLATHYDKLATTHRGGSVLRAITIWLKALGDTP